MKISKYAVQFIINKEVINPTYYLKKFSHPIWPGGESGITIGIGYDLGYASKEKIKIDWIGRVTNAELVELVKAAGITGIAAKEYLDKAKALQAINIKYETVYNFFIERSLPQYAKAALHIYPGLDELLPDAVGGIVSMVFNRGNSLTDSKKSIADKTYSRQEMRAIVPLVPLKKYNDIATLIDISKRLWVGKKQSGLITRREEEAALVRGANRAYDESEIIEITI